MKVHCESLDHRFELEKPPKRVVSLTSGTTEALFAMGCGDRVAGVSTYCSRYIRDLRTPVAGDYLKIDEAKFATIAPDLILVTTGVQRTLGLQLAQRGLPVYALPLASSFHGILENIVTVAGLLDSMCQGRQLVERLMSEAVDLRRGMVDRRPRVYVELWFGKHMRSIGGRSHIHDLVSMAGGDPILADSPQGYLEPDLEQVVAQQPEILLFFSEPEFPIDVQELMHERGWDKQLKVPYIESTVERGRNLIHDGPSLLETARWLHSQLCQKLG
jgi:iron complex transport system substrate-binding protein